uniref:Astaxanthin synthase KC28 n=1 Tax=Adonis palaestina TaxID=151078 RepID=A7YF26_9MAGN|nr:astaxanthin synthase KC28 [Adonis aestivalis var. palaestina]
MAPVLLGLKPTLSTGSVVKETNVGSTLASPLNKTQNSRVLVLGGTGKVGGSTALALSKFSPDLRLVIGGRNREKGDAVVSKLGENSEFVEVNVDSVRSLESALEDVDLVVHAAGPFQQAEKCTVLEAAISTRTAYVDVCDNTSYSMQAKSFHDKAVAANVPAITTAGIFPGVSNVIAAELVRSARDENTEPQRLRFSYFTAGSGGAGPTSLVTSFLLLGEEVVAYSEGEKVELKPYTGKLNIDFGKGVGKRDVYLWNLPEVRSGHEILGVPTVSARFGTAPFFWNWAMVAMTTLLPPGILRDRNKIGMLANFVYPSVQIFDGIAGECLAMRVDLECANGRNTFGILSHERLSVLVGTSTAVFAMAILEGSTQPGVWFPEEPGGIAISDRELLLQRASQGAINFIMKQ